MGPCPPGRTPQLADDNQPFNADRCRAEPHDDRHHPGGRRRAPQPLVRRVLRRLRDHAGRQHEDRHRERLGAAVRRRHGAPPGHGRRAARLARGCDSGGIRRAVPSEAVPHRQGGRRRQGGARDAPQPRRGLLPRRAGRDRRDRRVRRRRGRAQRRHRSRPGADLVRDRALPRPAGRVLVARRAARPRRAGRGDLQRARAGQRLPHRAGAPRHRSADRAAGVGSPRPAHRHRRRDQRRQPAAHRVRRERQPDHGDRRPGLEHRRPIFDPDRISASWLLFLPADHRPRLHRGLSRFLFSSNGLPFVPRLDEAEDTLVQLHGQAARPKLRATELDLPMPIGRRRRRSRRTTRSSTASRSPTASAPPACPRPRPPCGAPRRSS